MTRDQKQRLAQMVISQVANVFEVWDEATEIHGAPDIDQAAAAQQVANWLSKLPGDGWDTRLPYPTN